MNISPSLNDFPPSMSYVCSMASPGIVNCTYMYVLYILTVGYISAAAA